MVVMAIVVVTFRYCYPILQGKKDVRSVSRVDLPFFILCAFGLNWTHIFNSIVSIQEGMDQNVRGLLV